MVKSALDVLPEASSLTGVEPPSRLEPMMLEGEELGCWRLEECLGAGGLAEVYRATHVHLGVEAALKLTHFQHLEREDLTERFRREARVLMECKHPNIIEAKEFSIDELYGPYLVLELLKGYTLSSLLEEHHGLLSFDWVLGIAAQLCRALATIHKQGLVHRDLKPSNIFLIPNGEGVPELKLLDFGTAKVKLIDTDENLTTTGLIIGTPHYIAPEQIRAAGDVTAAADIYSLGAVFYEMLTGSLPHRATSAFQQLLLVLQEEPPPIRMHRPALAETSLERLIERMLSKSPEKRPGSVLIVKKELEQAIADLQAAVVADTPVLTTGEVSLVYATTTPLPAATRFVMQQTRVLSAKALNGHAPKTPSAIQEEATLQATPLAESIDTTTDPPGLETSPKDHRFWSVLGLFSVLLTIGLLSWQMRTPTASVKSTRPKSKRSFFGQMKLKVAVPKEKSIPAPVRQRKSRTKPKPRPRMPRRKRARPKPRVGFVSLRTLAERAYRKSQWKQALRLFHRYVKRFPNKLKDPQLKQKMRRCRCQLDIPLAWESCPPK